MSYNRIPVWIRQVIVPGITDDKNDLIKLKNFINTLKSVEKIELLPYHNLGKYKWENLNLKYPLDNLPAAAQEEIEKRYLDKSNWAKSCIINIAKSGYFTSDRTIREYIRDIWHLGKVNE